MKGVPGFRDRFPVPVESGKPAWYQSDGTRDVTPFHLHQRNVNAIKVDTTSHEMADTQAAWNQGQYGYWPSRPASAGGFIKIRTTNSRRHTSRSFDKRSATIAGALGNGPPSRCYQCAAWHSRLGGDLPHCLLVLAVARIDSSLVGEAISARWEFSRSS
jgi:hypothetical protein